MTLEGHIGTLTYFITDFALYLATLYPVSTVLFCSVLTWNLIMHSATDRPCYHSCLWANCLMLKVALKCWSGMLLLLLLLLLLYLPFLPFPCRHILKPKCLCAHFKMSSASFFCLLQGIHISFLRGWNNELHLNNIIRADGKSQVRQCLGFCAADFLSLLTYESAEEKPKHCQTWDFLSALKKMYTIGKIARENYLLFTQLGVNNNWTWLEPWGLQFHFEDSIRAKNRLIASPAREGRHAAPSPPISGNRRQRVLNVNDVVVDR